MASCNCDKRAQESSLVDAIERLVSILHGHGNRKRKDRDGEQTCTVEAYHDEVIQLCERYPRFLIHRVHRCVTSFIPGVWGRGRVGNKECDSIADFITPLGYLILTGASAEVIGNIIQTHKTVIDSDPSFLLNTNPLHLACVGAHSEKVKPGVVARLTRLFPGDVTRQVGSMIPFEWFTLYTFNVDRTNTCYTLKDAYADDLKTLMEATYPNGIHNSKIPCTTTMAESLMRYTLLNQSGPCIIDYLAHQLSGAPIHTIRLHYRSWGNESLGSHAKALCTLLPSLKRVKEIHIYFDSHFKTNVQPLVFQSIASCGSAIEKLDMHIDCENLATEALTSISKSLLSFPCSLRTFNLRTFLGTSGKLDLTEVVLRQLKHQKLQSLSLSGDLIVKPAPLFEALQHNMSLQRMEIWRCVTPDNCGELKGLAKTLWHYNTSLQRIDIYNHCGDSFPYEALIERLLRLNNSGRGALKDPEMPMGKLVDLLVYADNLRCNYGFGGKYNFCYAVLRQCPGKWSGHPASDDAQGPLPPSRPHRKRILDPTIEGECDESKTTKRSDC